MRLKPAVEADEKLALVKLATRFVTIDIALASDRAGCRYGSKVVIVPGNGALTSRARIT